MANTTNAPTTEVHHRITANTAKFALAQQAVSLTGARHDIIQGVTLENIPPGKTPESPVALLAFSRNSRFYYLPNIEAFGVIHYKTPKTKVTLKDGETIQPASILKFHLRQFKLKWGPTAAKRKAGLEVAFSRIPDRDFRTKEEQAIVKRVEHFLAELHSGPALHEYLQWKREILEGLAILAQNPANVRVPILCAFPKHALFLARAIAAAGGKLVDHIEINSHHMATKELPPHVMVMLITPEAFTKSQEKLKSFIQIELARAQKREAGIPGNDEIIAQHEELAEEIRTRHTRLTALVTRMEEATGKKQITGFRRLIQL